MHLLVSPLCAPPEYVERFAFIRERYDDPDHARQYVAAMTSLLDDIVGDVVAALRTAGLWENTLFVWSSDNGGAIELDTGMKNNYPLVNAAEPFPLYYEYSFACGSPSFDVPCFSIPPDKISTAVS